MLQFISRVRLRLTREMRRKNQDFRVSTSELENPHSSILSFVGIVLVIVSLVSFVVAQEKGIFGTRLPWYAVEPWEAEVCAKWGGHATASQETIDLGITPAGDMTMTVQGKKTKVQTGQYLYEVSYYLESFGATTHYHLSFINPTTHENKTITEGTLAPGTGATDYLTEYSHEKYTHLRLAHDRGIIITPIIEVR